MRLSILSTFGLVATLSTACSTAFDKGGADLSDEDTGDTQDTQDTEDTQDTQDTEDTDTGPDPDDIDDDNDGYTENQGDCDDNNNTINPAADDDTVDGDDQDCDGFDGPDADNDGYADMVAGGTDCDDNDANVNPGQAEDPNDGVDTDCDGVGDARFQTGYVDELCIDCAGPSAVAVDSAGQVHVVYEDAGDLWYRYLQAFGTWSNYEKLGADAAGRTPAFVTSEWYGLDAKVDGADNVQVAYVSDGSSETALYFMFRDSAGNWSDEYFVDGYDPNVTDSPTDVGWHVSMAIDSGDFPAFSYFNNNEKVPYIYDLTDSLVSNVLDLSGAYFSLDFCQSVVLLGYDTTCSGFYSGMFSGIALDANDNAHVAFYNHNESFGVGAKENQYARIPDISDSNAIGLYNDPTSLLNGDLCHWITNSIGSIDQDNEGMYNSTAIKSEGNGDICVAYYSATSADLKYACKSQTSGCGSWVTETVDTAGDVGKFASLDFNSQNQPYIAYYDTSTSSLKVATKENNIWEIIDVDTEGNVGQYADLDIDDNDIVHITYLEDAGTKGKLRYAWGR